jgi:hypothetical protein
VFASGLCHSLFLFLISLDIAVRFCLSEPCSEQLPPSVAGSLSISDVECSLSLYGGSILLLRVLPESLLLFFS